MPPYLYIGLTLINVLRTAPPSAPHVESPRHAPSRAVEITIGPRASASRPRANKELARRLPGQMRFIADLVPPPPVPTPGLVAITQAKESSERASTVADAARCLPEALSPPSAGAAIGVGFASAAIALHPTLTAPASGTTIQVAPRFWPPGINIQGAFF